MFGSRRGLVLGFLFRGSVEGFNIVRVWVYFLRGVDIRCDLGSIFLYYLEFVLDSYMEEGGGFFRFRVLY